MKGVKAEEAGHDRVPWAHKSTKLDICLNKVVVNVYKGCFTAALRYDINIYKTYIKMVLYMWR